MTKQILKQLLYIFLFVLGLAFTYIFVVIIFPFARDSISNNIKLKNMETALSRIEHPVGTSLISTRGAVGVLWGNSNHCDFYVGEMRQFDGDRQKVLDFYHSPDINIAFIENKIMPDGFTTFDVPYELNTFADWGISPADLPANLYLVYTFDGLYDPGMDFRCH